MLSPRGLLRWTALGFGLCVAVALLSIPAWRLAFERARDDGRLEGWANRRPEKLQVSWTSIDSSGPGSIELRGLRVAGRTERRLWEVRADEVAGRIEPLPLVFRELRFTRIRARGVSFRATATVQTERDGALARLPEGAKPVIGGFGDGPVTDRRAVSRPWTFSFRDARLEDVREIWSDDRILRGRLDASGGFELRDRRTARIFPSRIGFTDATAWAGGTAFARDLEGSLRFRTGSYPYRGATVERVLAALTGQLTLAGRLDTDPFLDALLSPWPTFEIDSGAIDVEARLELVRAVLGPGSRIEIRERGQRVRFLGFEARGDAHLTATVGLGGTGPELATDLRLEHWQLGRPGEPGLLLGEGLHFEAVSEPLAWGERPRPLSLAIDLGQGEIPDLRFLNDYLPPAADTRIASGRASVGGTIRFAGTSGSGEGAIRVRGEQLRIEARGQQLEGKLDVDLALSNPDLVERTFGLRGTRLMLRELAALTSEGDRVKGWWGEVTLPGGRVELDRPVRLAGDFRARLADTRPLIAFYEVKRDLPSWAERLLTLEGVSASGAFAWAPGRFELSRSEVPLPRGELRTRLLLEKDRRLGKLLARWRRLVVGLEIDGKEHRVRVRDAEEWFEEPGFERLPSRVSRETLRVGSGP